LKKNYVWSGIFEDLDGMSFKEMPAFISERWLSQINTQLLEYRNGNDQPPPRFSELPVIAAISEVKSILDFGGSSGWAYYYLMKTCCAFTKQIKKYSIYELPKLCEYFNVNQTHSDALKYISNPNEIVHHDLLYSNSMIQYMPNEDDLIKSIRNSTPLYIVFENFLGGAFKDFYTEQNYYEYKIAVKFRNTTNFISLIENLGYELIVNKIYLEPIRGVINKFDMENFPKNLRVDYGKTLIFKKT
jgi:putative methyltransferase (TIGR04325 family)